jgi:hypothetical protein
MLSKRRIKTTTAIAVLATLAVAVPWVLSSGTAATAAVVRNTCHSTKPGGCLRYFDPCEITWLEEHPKFAAYSTVGAWSGYNDNLNALNPHGAAGVEAYPAWWSGDLNELSAACPPGGHNTKPYPPKP